VADAPLPAPGRRSWRPAAIVAAALAAIVLLAALADGRLLIADPDASAVTSADVRLARSLFGDAIPPEALLEVCIDDEGTVDPACLDGGEPAGDPGDLDELTAEVIPRECRDAASVDASCIEEELGIDLPDECVDDTGDVDVGCAAAGGDLLVLTDRCLSDRRLRVECLTGRVYGVPDPGPDEELDGPGPTFVPFDQAPVDPDRPDVDPPVEPEDEDADTPEADPKSGWETAVETISRGLGLLLGLALLVGLIALVVLAARRWRPSRPGAPVEPEPDEDAHDRAVMAASLAAGARQLDLSGDPRQAIIAAYAMLLEGLAACAQGRHPAETPLEHLERVLAALDVRPEPLRDLTTLFGEARFSDHPMTDGHRDRARAALDAAISDLDRVREAVG
jgi:hypothetical protein